eukprot:scaffold60601_cov32-Tisochrysis_lutea.AAC.4
MRVDVVSACPRRKKACPFGMTGSVLPQPAGQPTGHGAYSARFPSRGALRQKLAQGRVGPFKSDAAGAGAGADADAGAGAGAGRGCCGAASSDELQRNGATP